MYTPYTRRLAYILIFSLMALVQNRTAHATLIAYWNFNDSNTTVDQGAGTITNNLVSGDVNFQAGTTENAVGLDPAGNSLNFKRDANNGKWVTFAISTVGLQDLVLTFSTMKSSSGFSNNQVSYSSDGGGSFTNFGGPYNPPNAFAAAGSLKTFDFTSIPALNNNADVQIRLTLNGATNNGGMKRIDNIQFNATPEPATLAGMLLGALALRRRRSVQA